jgi:hypothetical protein
MNKANTKIIYLASPYADKDPKVMEARRDVCDRIAMRLMERGYIVFSPLSHTVPIAKHMKHKMKDRIEMEALWLGQDAYWVKQCSDLYIVMQKGWKDSRGVCAETMLARALGLLITYIDPLDRAFI